MALGFRIVLLLWLFAEYERSLKHHHSRHKLCDCLHRVAPLVPKDDEIDVTLEALTNSGKLEGEASPSPQIDGSQSSTEGKQRFRAQPQSLAPSSLQTAKGANIGKDRLDIWRHDVLIGLPRVVTF